MIDLSTATEALYKIFAIYPFNPGMQSCPCCVSSEDQHSLSGPLRELKSEQISRYAFKAMTTWGTNEDFKHYLPRIFELLGQNALETDDFVVLGKLNHAGWQKWPQAEQEAIKNFLLAWWRENADHCYNITESLVRISEYIGKIDPLLESWKIEVPGQSFIDLADFIYHEFYHLSAQKGNFKDLNSDDSGKLIDWLMNHKSMLEEGFFYYEKSEPSTAKMISDALMILETHGRDLF